ncbi:hypothetical protein LCGC14_0671500 [marine sediment metagenome]|uniref:Uncharacterized protein n=1 Tax=marine sediment metagenome TaxID=412755 RepID=A0A0F9TC52_9ZZZZ
MGGVKTSYYSEIIDGTNKLCIQRGEEKQYLTESDIRMITEYGLNWIEMWGIENMPFD